ncbi:MAG TPA: AmmeMemoRadiSam system radical SAM enzyme, partial [Aquificaceae bacterium]|nr:AmmeMemoRadiSam system radical SAM enzyme [Aquificaceae bacterium]
KTTMTFSTYSCNLDCPGCQNWHISKVDPTKIYDFISPERIV